MSYYTVQFYERLGVSVGDKSTWDTVEQAKEVAEAWHRGYGYNTEIVDDEGSIVWSSSQPDARWRKLRERVTAEIGPGHEPHTNDAYRQVLAWIAELESEGDDEYPS